MADDLNQNSPLTINPPAPVAAPPVLPALDVQPPAPLPAAGPQNGPSFQDPQMTTAPVQPLVPVEPVSTTLQDAWRQEVAAPQGQINPPVSPALPDANVFAAAAPTELVPPLATQLPQQAPEAHPAVVSDVTGAPAPLPEEPATVEPPSDDQPPQAPPADGVSAPDPFADSAPTESGDAAAAPAEGGDDKKSPLEILEEILAGANAEKDMKAKEEEEKKAKEAQDAAEFAAKEAAFEQEAQAKLAETTTALEEAKAHREKVDAEIEANNPTNEMPATLEIHQLGHDTIQTTQ